MTLETDRTKREQHMNFGQAITSMYKKYATFTGRARRSEYWWALLYYAIVAEVINFATTTYSVDPFTGISMPVYSPIYYIWILGHFLPFLGLGIRRMHDLGKSGAYILIPIYNIVLLATDSVPGQNAYGAPVK